MGRRARTTASPVDTAMEKYHSDIGNRLSGAVIASAPTHTDQGTGPDVFAMLTLDLRHGNSFKKPSPAVATDMPDVVKSHLDIDTFCSCDNTLVNSEAVDVASSTCIARDNRTYCAISLQSQEDQTFTVKEKKSIVDKLARALFQRKHTCARCQRKSKSCLPNKNFNGTEGHYMCGRCRETCHVIKNLVSGQSGSSHDRQTAISTDIIKPQPRLHLNDSGYDTVTSCSTVASSYSAYQSPPKANTDSNSNVSATQAEELSRKDNRDTPRRPGLQPCCQKPAALANPRDLHYFMGVASDGSGAMLKQVKTGNIRNYDGYLHQESVCDNSHSNVCPVRPPLSDATNLPTACTCDHGHDHTHEDRQVESSKASDGQGKTVKACYTCGSTSKPCFHLPWEGGWLCEDCLDGLH